MPILIMLLGALGTAVFWIYRAKSASRDAQELLNVANDVRLAARRFGFKRKANVHPVNSIEDARLAAAGIMAITAEMDGAITRAEQDEMAVQAKNVFNCSAAEVDEFVVFGRWIASQGANRDETLRKLIKRVIELGGKDVVPDLVEMVTAVGSADTGTPDSNVAEIITRLQRAR